MSGPFPPSQNRRTRAIVLVHGAWVGEWCWEPLMSRLGDRRVEVVSLTGHGVRSHQNGPHITLADHVNDVVAVVETHDLTDITMVAHSYGGRVATAAAVRLSDRLDRIVYLDAHAPVPGDIPLPAPAPSEVVAGMVRPGAFPPDPAVFGESGVRWFERRLMPQSAATMVDFPRDLPAHVRRCFVYAGRVVESPFRAYADAAAASPDWEYHEVAADHWLMVSDPEAIARIITEET